MSHHVVSGLAWTRETVSPWPKGRGPRKASRKEGLAYERAVAKVLPLARYQQWFEFGDRSGSNFCAPDLLLDVGAYLVCLECKLTDWPEAKLQLSQLYLPVLAHHFGKPIRGVVVAKNLSFKSNLATVADNFAKAAYLALNSPSVWHLPSPRLAHLSCDFATKPRPYLFSAPKLAIVAA